LTVSCKAEIEQRVSEGLNISCDSGNPYYQRELQVQQFTALKFPPACFI